MITEEECIDALQKAEQMLNGTYSKREYDELALAPSSSSIQRIVGGWDEAKEIAGVEKVNANDRVEREIVPKPDGIEIPEGETWESLTSYQRYYYRNRQDERERAQKRKEKIFAWFFAEKQKYTCVNCGESHPAALDFITLLKIRK